MISVTAALSNGDVGTGAHGDADLRGLTPDDLIDISVMNRLHFHAALGEGVAFHLPGALSEFGKLGVVYIGRTHER